MDSNKSKEPTTLRLTVLLLCCCQFGYCVLLVMSILMNLKTSQIDYTAAFVHAPIDCLIYVDASIRFRTQVGDVDCIWQLNISLYDLCQSLQNYFLYTKEKLESIGFTQSIADSCLFMSTDIICLIYIDNALPFYKGKLAIKN